MNVAMSIDSYGRSSQVPGPTNQHVSLAMHTDDVFARNCADAALPTVLDAPCKEGERVRIEAFSQDTTSFLQAYGILAGDTTLSPHPILELIH
jgi:hypothetical protein